MNDHPQPDQNNQLPLGPLSHLPLQWIMLFNVVLLAIVILIGGIFSYLDIQAGLDISNDNLAQAQNTSVLLTDLDGQLTVRTHLHRIQILAVAIRNQLNRFLQDERNETTPVAEPVKQLHIEFELLKAVWYPEFPDRLIGDLQAQVDLSLAASTNLREDQARLTGKTTYPVAKLLLATEIISQKVTEIEKILDGFTEKTVRNIQNSNQHTIANAQTLSGLIEMFELRYLITLLIVITIATTFQIVFYKILKERLGSVIQITSRISTGNLADRVDRISKDEIGALAQSFNHMLDRLESAQKENIANKTYLDDIFHSMLNSLVVINPDKTIQTVNHALLKLLAYREEELLGKPIDLIFPNHPDYLCSENYIETTSQSHILHGEEHTLLSKQGEQKAVMLSCSIIRDMFKKSRGVVCVAQDISQIKQMEADRKKLEEQLRQSQKMEAIGTLAGGIAHDFNNILSTMQGFTWLLLADKDEDSEERDYLNEIYVAGERAAELIQQILTFSRTDNQEQKALRLPPLVKEALRFMRATIPKSIKIRQEIDPDCQTIQANATQIYQIIINLCTNALQAMKNGQGVLTVTLDQVDQTDEHELKREFPENSFVRITVSDTGHGIRSEIKNRIFEPFFTTKEVGEGTGLGLSVVHGIIKNHKGRVFVRSEQKKGTSFEVYLPVVEGPGVDDTTGEIQNPAKGHEHILLVEDEPSLARFYEIALKQLGYSVSIAKNGTEALHRFQHQMDNIDLVYTDQAMPTMSGIQLSQELLRLDPDLPIILASGFKGENMKSQAEATGIRYFLEKPVNIGKLTKIIREVFDPVLIKNRSGMEENPGGMKPDKNNLDSTEDVIYKNKEFRDIIPLFLDERQKEISLVLEAVSKADYEAIYSLGHKMQGASEAFGFTTVSKIGLSLKQSAMKGENELIQNRLTELKTYLEQLENDYNL